MADRAEPGDLQERAASATATAEPARVFISHASGDAAVAAALVESLERHGIACWIAPRDVKAGAQYADAIARAISAAKALVLVLSEGAIASSHVGKEVERASSKKRPIFPLRIDTAPLTPALEYFLSESQWVEAQAENKASAYARLIDAIRELERTAPEINPSMTPSAGTARTERPKSPPKRILIAAVLIVAAAALAALLVGERIWFAGSPDSPRVATESAPEAAPESAVDHERQGALTRGVAVLPFDNLSPDADDAYFAGGMHEDVLIHLSRIAELRVISRTSVQQIAETGLDMAAIGQRLGVSHVLEGSVRRAADRVRVTVQLIDAASDEHVWAENYDRTLDDVFAIQSEIALAIAEEIRISLTPQEEEYFARSREIDPAAQRAYLHGLYHSSRYALGGESFEPEMILKSIEFFEQAVEIESGWAEAYAKLAGAYHWSASSGAPGPGNIIEHYQRSKAAAQKAIQLDDSVADAHGALGFVLHNFDLDWAGAEREYHRTFELEPNNGYRWGYDLFLVAAGRYDEAAANSPVEQEPLSRILRKQLSNSLACAGRYEESLEVIRDFFHPGSVEYDSLLANLELARRSPARAINLLETHAQSRSDEYVLETLAYAYAVAGREADARAVLPGLEARDAWIPYVYAVLGETDKAMAQLEKTWTTQRERLTYMRCLPQAGYADLTEFEGLRDHPRFQAMLKEIAFP
jgi:TolB-like protein